MDNKDSSSYEGMAAVQWIADVQKRLVPQEKEATSRYEKNLQRRYREAVREAIKKGYLKLLDRELILQLQEESEGEEAATELYDVLRISLQGCRVQSLDEIALLSCTRLRICNVESSYISDMRPFFSCVNLLKLDLSNNQILNIPSGDFWSSLKSLQVLYLHCNAISNLQNIERINYCQTLCVLTLHDTPISLIKGYRHQVVNSILSLKALDQYVISDQEIIENLHLPGKFKPMTAHFRVQLYQVFPKNTVCKEEIGGVHRLVSIVNSVLSRHSPVHIIQRWVRGWLVRRALSPPVRRKSTSPSKKANKKTKSDSILVDATATSDSNQSGNTSVKKSQSAGHVSFPPAPPTTPQHVAVKKSKSDVLWIESRVLEDGNDSSRSRTKCSVHINLKCLQDGSEEKTFVRARAKRDEKEKKKKSKSVKFSSEDQLENEKHTSTTPVPTITKTTIEVSGESAVLIPVNCPAEMIISRKEGGRMVRSAEREISKLSRQHKQAPSPRKRQSSPLRKDEVSFLRAYTTITLSALRAAEKAHTVMKKSEQKVEKAKLVAKMRHEREERKEKIEEYHKSVKEEISSWKECEEQRLNQVREQLEARKKNQILRTSQLHDMAIVNSRQQAEERRFAQEFNLQSTMMASTLLQHDHRAFQEVDWLETQEQVGESKEVSREHHQLVKDYMAQREARLLQENAIGKKQLGTAMLEAATQRMIEAQRRVAREHARKEAARMALAIAKEELSRGEGGGGGMTAMAFSTNPSLELKQQNLAAPQSSQVRLTQERKTNNVERAEYRSSAWVRNMNKDAHRTWQRGDRSLNQQCQYRSAPHGHTTSTTTAGGADAQNNAHVVTHRNQHFPLIPAGSESALMYEMMKPAPMLQMVSGSACTSSTGTTTPSIMHSSAASGGACGGTPRLNGGTSSMSSGCTNNNNNNKNNTNSISAASQVQAQAHHTHQFSAASSMSSSVGGVLLPSAEVLLAEAC